MSTQQTNYTSTRVRPLNYLPSTAAGLWRIFFIALALGIVSKAHAGADIQYLLTTQYDPAIPDQIIEFDVTVHNLAASSQSVTLDWTVPQFTVFGGQVAGSPQSHDFGSLTSGQSVTYQIRLTVLSAAVVPDGSEIVLTLRDLARPPAMAERRVVVRDLPALGLALSTEQGTVALGDNFTYTLAAANISGSSLPNAELTAVVPQGATFVSADSGGVLSNGVVSWTLGTLGPGANERRHVVFQADAGGSPPLGSVDAMLADGNGHVARASDARVVIGMPLFQYIVTAVQDPVRPSQILEFDVTVHNLTMSSQSVRLDWTVPQYTVFGGQVAGSPQSHNFGTLTEGQSVTYQIRLSVMNTAAVPDGANITLELFDLVRGASVSRSVVVRDVPVLGLALSTEQGTVALGDNFTYTLAAANLSESSLPNAELTAVVPQGATFVSADSGGVLSNGVVTWTLGTLGPGANERRHVVFQADAGGSPPLGSVDAMLTDGNGHVARASDARVVIGMPLFQYIVTAMQDPVQPSQILEFDVTVRNLTMSSQSVTLDWTVPQYTVFGGQVAGSPQSHDFGVLTEGQSITYQIRLSVMNTAAVPEGANITLDLFDLVRGASVSRSVVVRDVPALGLALSTEQASVALGDNFTYTMAAANISGSSLPNAELTMVVPQGATFVSADNGGVLSNGVVTWTLGTLGPGANERRHVVFQADAGGSPPLGPVDAMLTDGNGYVARASDVRVVIAMPLFEYTVAAVQDPVQQNQTLEFDVTVHNLTMSSQSVRLDWTVPHYTVFGGQVAGSPQSHDFGTLTSGQSMTYVLLLNVLQTGSVPNGANITLDMFHLVRGASVPRTVAVNPHTSGTPTPTPTPGGSVTPTPTPGGTPGRLANISTRLRVETDNNVLIGGFIVTGTQSKRVILRAIGPSLASGGVQGALANPALELHDSSGLIASNDNWMDAPNRQEIIDSTLAPADNLESAILMTLPANGSAYTAIVRGVANSTGVALVEAYDLDLAANSRLANISTRGLVQTGDNVMIGGFIIVGQAPARVIIRAIGGSLSVQGNLTDPTLELRDANGALIASNDNWRSDQEAEIIATGIAPTNDMESAIVRTLNPGGYTAIVRGVNNTTGIALVEVYQLNN